MKFLNDMTDEEWKISWDRYFIMDDSKAEFSFDDPEVNRALYLEMTLVQITHGVDKNV